MMLNAHDLTISSRFDLRRSHGLDPLQSLVRGGRVEHNGRHYFLDHQLLVGPRRRRAGTPDHAANLVAAVRDHLSIERSGSAGVGSTGVRYTVVCRDGTHVAAHRQDGTRALAAGVSNSDSNPSIAEATSRCKIALLVVQLWMQINNLTDISNLPAS